jgi:antitoxin component of RelBE/YafQ-DinJ toxin-antitoxin module
MINKNKKVEFKIEEQLLKEWKSICDKNGYDMSKRLRIYIQKEIELDSKGLNLINIIEDSK